MAILSKITDFMLYLKESTGYVLYRLSAKCVAMDNGNDLQTEIDELNSKITHFFSYGEVDSIEVTAPYDCSVEITHTFLGWGYAGNLFVFGINSSSSGITKKCENFGGCQGGDTVNKYLRADAVYTGLKKGQKYTFSRQEITGGSGARNNRRWTVICHPE